MKTNDGGPAFPTDSERQVGQYTWHHAGMTLRDYFAAAALQGWLASFSSETKHPCDVDGSCELQAKRAYAIADAMLKERTS